MKSSILVFIGLIVWSSQIFSQNDRDNRITARPIALLSGLKIPLDNYGNFSVAFHKNRDTLIANYKNFQTTLALVVGGLTEKGDTIAFSGETNGKTRVPEWYPTTRVGMESFTLKGQMIDHSQSEYCNLSARFDESGPKIIVKQDTYQPRDKSFIVIHLRVKGSEVRGLKRAYIGLFGMFRLADENGKRPIAGQSINFTNDGKTPIVNVNSKTPGGDAVAMVCLTEKSKQFKYWESDGSVETDAKLYHRFAATQASVGADATAFKVVNSFGPFNLAADTEYEVAFLVCHTQNNLMAELVIEGITFNSQLVLGLTTSGATSLTKDIEDESALNGAYELFQNVPNPFNPMTNIGFQLAKPSMVSITVFDILGRSFNLINDVEMNQGVHTIVFDARSISGSSLSSGIYFYKFDARAMDGSGGMTQIKKMLLLK